MIIVRPDSVGVVAKTRKGAIAAVGLLPLVVCKAFAGSVLR